MTSADVPAAAVTAQSPRDQSTAALLVATDIEKSYRSGLWPLRRRQEILRNASLSLFPGEVVGLVGENGSGKSTLMKTLVGAVTADAGTTSSGTARSNLLSTPDSPLTSTLSSSHTPTG